jgi:uncharacterized protein YyaL (SSP411 family)
MHDSAREASRPANRLAPARSPYLRQHAHNPVDWHPWGPEALQRARLEHKPILLSIGYAACHWCHVMAHESFEDQATARLMNELFVCIKVDREERPDVDRLYQLAQQMLTGRGGGWPLTMFLMHDDQRPFFGGTYFPSEPRHGLPAFRDVLAQVAAYYREHSDELRQPAAQIAAALNELHPPPSAAPLTDAPIGAARAELERNFDGEYGGFGGAPKFPHAAAVTRLLRDWHASAQAATPDLQALYMSTLTLTRMAEGGLFDQLGGGFYRYAVDERWEIPHFEKMLYDNGQLLEVYAEAATASGEELFRDVAARTGEWLLSMRAPDGGFYASLDADSEGHEGRYYVWDRAQVQALLEPAQWPPFAARYGLDQPPNFEGRWHLTARRGIDAIAAAQSLEPAQVSQLLEAAQQRLLAARVRRVAPGLDDKRLTSWNALAIKGLAVAARRLQRPDFGDAAARALDLLRSQHWRDGRLLAHDGQGSAALPAYLDDYAFLIYAVLELASWRFRAGELAFAVALADTLLQHFADTAGGFFFTADDHEALIARPKSFGDEALPAGNAVAASALLRLGHLLGESRYLDAAERSLRAAWPAIERYPTAHAASLNALEELLHPVEIVLLRGPAAAIAEWQRQLDTVYAPRRWTLAVPNAEDPPGPEELPPALAAKTGGAAPVAYICRGSVCSAPLTSLDALAATLRGAETGG